MPHVTVEVAPVLRPLLPRRERGEEVTREMAPTETVAHLLQILGVPLTEVGEAAVDRTPVGHAALRSTRLGNAETVAVGARERPQPNSGRFLLDVHLGTLARRMRLLGLDAAYEPEADDADLAERSRAERRELLTRDRGLLFRRAVLDGALIRSDDVEVQLEEVLGRFAPTLSPWTRCLRCGGLLAAVPAAEVAGRLEPGTRRSYDAFSRCVRCRQVYWRGAHSERLEALVRRSQP